MITTRSSQTTFTGWISYGLGATAAILVMLVCKGLKLMLLLLVTLARTPNRRALEKPKAAQFEPPSIEYVGRDWSHFEPATTRCLQFPGIGYLSIWAYQTTRVVLRQLTLSDPKLVKVVGARRVPLPRMTWAAGMPLSAIEDDSARQVESWLAKRVRGASPDATELRKSTAQPQQEQVRLKNPEPNSKTAGSDRQVPYAHGLGRASRLVHEGRLLQLEQMPRLLDGENVMHLGARLRSKDGAINIVWGNDLYRAAEEAGANVGDEVRIEHLGRHPVVLEDGTEARKSVFAIQVKGKHP